MMTGKTCRQLNRRKFTTDLELVIARSKSRLKFESGKANLVHPVGRYSQGAEKEWRQTASSVRL